MNRDQFWDLVEQSRKDFRADRRDGNMDGQIYALRELLLELSPSEVLTFADTLHDYMVEAYAWDLWGAADLLYGGSCSDDGFTDFCSWLISMGRRTYESTLADPDSLAASVYDPTVEDFSFEEFQSIPAQVYEEMTGKEVPGYSRDYPDLPRGEKSWEKLDELRRQYPRIWAAIEARSGTRSV